MELIPRDNAVILEPLKAEKYGGLHLPRAGALDPDDRMGRVVAVGPGRIVQEEIQGKQSLQRRPVGVQMGDVVIFSRGLAAQPDLQGPIYMIVPDDAILAVVDGYDEKKASASPVNGTASY